MTAITIRDMTTTGEVINEWTLAGLEETTTVTELIRSRIYQEVKDYNARDDAKFRGLIQPAVHVEKNVKPEKDHHANIDWETQFKLAIEAFEKNQILILVDDQQVESLDQEVSISPSSCVSFLRLVLLAGG